MLTPIYTLWTEAMIVINTTNISNLKSKALTLKTIRNLDLLITIAIGYVAEISG
ncbi:MAG: hypothetical protein ACI4I6_09430 [Hominimerdicola sp.]